MIVPPILTALAEPFREPKRLVARAACWGALVLFLVNAEAGNSLGIFQSIVILAAAWGINHRAGTVAVAIVRAEDFDALQSDEDIEAFLRDCVEGDWAAGNGRVGQTTAPLGPAADQAESPAGSLNRRRTVR